MMWLFLLCSLAFADDVVTVEKGAPAPFTGTLLSPEAAARLLATGERDLEICKIDAARDLALMEADGNKKLALCQAELAAAKYRFDQTQLIYQDQIKYLEKRAIRPSWETPVTFIGGIIVGVGVVSLSAWTLDKIQEN